MTSIWGIKRSLGRSWKSFFLGFFSVSSLQMFFLNIETDDPGPMNRKVMNATALNYDKAKKKNMANFE